MNRSRTIFILVTTVLLAAAVPVAAVIPEETPCAGVEFCEEQIDPRATYALAYGIILENYLNAEAAKYHAYADSVAQDTTGEIGRSLENVNILNAYAGQVQTYVQAEFIPYVNSLDDNAAQYAGELVGYGMVKKDDLAGFAYYLANFSGVLGGGMRQWVYVVDETDGAEVPQLPPFTPESYFAVPPEMPPAAADVARPPPPPPAQPELYLPDAPEATPMPDGFPVPEYPEVDYDAQKAEWERLAWEAASLTTSQAEVSTTTVAATGTAPPPPTNCTHSYLSANPDTDLDGDGLSNKVEGDLLALFDGNPATFDPCDRYSDADGIPDGVDGMPDSTLPIQVRIQVKAIRQLQYMDCCDYWWGAGDHVWGDPYLYGGVKWGTSTTNHQSGALNFEGLRQENHHHDDQVVTIDLDPIEAGQDLILDLPADINAWSHAPPAPTLHFEFVLADHDACVDDVYPKRGNTDGPCGVDPSLAKELMEPLDKELFQIVYQALEGVNGEFYDGVSWLTHTITFGDMVEVDLRIHVGMDLCGAARITQAFGAVRATGSFSSPITTLPSYC